MKFILFVIVLSVVNKTANAQSVPVEVTLTNYEQFAQRESTFVIAQLSLTNVQSDSVLEIYKSYFYKIADLRTQHLSINGRGEKLQGFYQEWKQRLKNNLSNNQYNQWVMGMELMKKKTDSLRALHSRQLGTNTNH